MNCAHKESVHLGEKVTLNLIQRYYWRIGMADSVKMVDQKMLYLSSEEACANYHSMAVSLPAPT